MYKKHTPFIFYDLLVTRVVDGDTIYGIKKEIFHSGRTRKITLEDKVKIRIIGIDTPEIRGKKKTKKGIMVKNYVKQLLQGKSFVYRYTDKKDSFGRELGDIMLPGNRSLSLHLISMGYGKEMKK